MWSGRKCDGPKMIDASAAKITICRHASVAGASASRQMRVRAGPRRPRSGREKGCDRRRSAFVHMGVQMWNGTALILKAMHANTNTKPKSRPSDPCLRAQRGGDAVEVHRAGKAVKQRNAVEQVPLARAPSTKYLRPASAERSSVADRRRGSRRTGSCSSKAT